jgi:hypothetical protein
VIAVATAAMFGALAAPAMAQSGGTTTPSDPGTAPPPSSGTPGVATIQPDGSALAPPDAPRPVRKAINAANRIRYKPYIYGGGHRSFKAKGYDCSGAVSYVLHAAGLLKRPMSSGPLAKRWGTFGTGQWITVYGNRGHAYAVIAGLRWDTSAVGEPLNSGSGPRWRSTARSSAGYNPKYWPGL